MRGTRTSPRRNGHSYRTNGSTCSPSTYFGSHVCAKYTFSECDHAVFCARWTPSGDPCPAPPQAPTGWRGGVAMLRGCRSVRPVRSGKAVARRSCSLRCVGWWVQVRRVLCAPLAGADRLVSGLVDRPWCIFVVYHTGEAVHGVVLKLE